MIKAATTTVSLLLLMAAGATAFAQPSPAPSTADIATAEAIRRQASIIDLRRPLNDAARLHKEGNLVESARQYERALDLVRDVGTGVEVESKDAVAGLA